MDGRLKEIINLASSTIVNSYISTVSHGKLIQFLTGHCGKKRKKRINNCRVFTFFVSTGLIVGSLHISTKVFAIFIATQS